MKTNIFLLLVVAWACLWQESFINAIAATFGCLSNNAAIIGYTIASTCALTVMWRCMFSKTNKKKNTKK